MTPGQWTTGPPPTAAALQPFRPARPVPFAPGTGVTRRRRESPRATLPRGVIRAGTVALLLYLLSPGPARPDEVLGESHGRFIFGSPEVETEISFGLGYCDLGTAGCGLFRGRIVDLSRERTVLTVSRANDPYFAEFAGWLTDGEVQPIAMRIFAEASGENVEVEMTEWFFFRLSPPDLVGETIGSVTLEVWPTTVTPGDEGGTDIDATLVVRVWDVAVPVRTVSWGRLKRRWSSVPSRTWAVTR